MHELSLALEVCRMAEERLAGDSVSRLRGVGVEVGEHANVEVENFRFCLEALLGAPPFAGAVATVTLCTGEDLRLVYLEVDDGRPDD